MSTLTLRAPLSGWAMPLAEVPDPVFAGGMMGEGVAIDPTDDLLLAPCDGEIVSVPATAHAVTLRAANGAELLLHVGIDTVALGGRGFTALVTAGQRVATGDGLLRFDLDAVARSAPSLVTPVIVTNSVEFELAQLRSGRVKVGELLFELRPVSRADSPGVPEHPAIADEAPAVRRSVRVGLPHGIHARPAALIVRTARESSAEITLRAHDRSASARSAVALLSLGVVAGDEVIVEARGRDGAAAVDAIERLLREGGEHAAQPPVAGGASMLATTPAPAAVAALEPGDEVTGVVASSGVAVGPAFVLKRVEREVVEAGQGVDHETRALDSAIDAVRRHLETLARTGRGGESAIVAAHLEFLDDPELRAAPCNRSDRVAVPAMRGVAPYGRTSMRCDVCRMRGFASAPTICSISKDRCWPHWRARNRDDCQYRVASSCLPSTCCRRSCSRSIPSVSRACVSLTAAQRLTSPSWRLRRVCRHSSPRDRRS
jgi:phosphocarrier protein FPr/phosphocarrier protein